MRLDSKALFNIATTSILLEDLGSGRNMRRVEQILEMPTIYLARHMDVREIVPRRFIRRM